MTHQQFHGLKSLIQENGRGVSRSYEMIGRIYEEHGGRLDRVDGRLNGLEVRLTRVEVLQEQFSHDLRAVAEGVTGNGERLDRLEGGFDRFEVNFQQLSDSVTAGFTEHARRLRALED